MATRGLGVGALKALQDAREVERLIEKISENAVSGDLDLFEVRQGLAMDLKERTDRLAEFAMWVRG